MVGLKLLRRRQRIIELRCLGLTIPQIYEKLRDEGFHACEKTIWSDLHSATAEAFVEELKRKQLADITLCNDDYATRLKYRDLLLDKLLPRLQKVEAKVEGLPRIVVEVVDNTKQDNTISASSSANPDSQ